MEPILQIKQVTKDFGGLRALDQLDLDVFEKEIVALIGPNGAGKTTFFNCITGIYPVTQGEMRVLQPGKRPKRLNGLKPNRITALGLARTFQNIRLFQNMTVMENVMVGRHCRMSAGIAGAVFRPRSTVLEEERTIEESYRILGKFGLTDYVNEFAKNLPYGAQRRLEIARAMATEPVILLLDEPAAGMNPGETRELHEFILRIRDEDHVSILLIEHDMRLVMSLSDRIVVMDYGRKIAQGSPDEIRRDPAVIKAYLGEDTHA